MDISLFPIGLALFTGVAVFVVMRYLQARRAGQNPVLPVRPNLPAIVQLIAAAFAGNKPMVKVALDAAFEAEWKEGDPVLQVLEYAIFEVEQRSVDPNRRAYVIEAIAKFTGLTEAEVIESIKQDIKPRPVLPAATPLVGAALALCLFCGSASAGYPGQDIQGPQRFYPAPDVTIVDQPLCRDRNGRLCDYKPAVSYPRYATGDSVCPYCPGPPLVEPNYPAVPRFDAPASTSQRSGFMRRGVGRVLRGVGRVVSAPFRLLFRRGC